MSDELLEGLRTDVRSQFVDFLSELRVHGFPVVVAETLRTPERQKMLFEQGFSKQPIGGKHIFGLALDFFDPRSPWAEQPDLFAVAAIGARKLGLKTGLLFGLPLPLARPRSLAIVKADLETLVTLITPPGGKRGFDPLHVEWAGTRKGVIR